MTLCHNIRATDPFLRLHKASVMDAALSWKAKGILAYAFSRPDNWEFYKDEMMSHGSDGDKSFTSGLVELEKFGYLYRKPKRDGATNKMLGGWDWYWFEIAITLDEFKKVFGNRHFADDRETRTSAKGDPTKKEEETKNDPYGSKGATPPPPPTATQPKRKPKTKRREHVDTTDQEHARLVEEYGEATAERAYDELEEWKIITPRGKWKLDDNRSIRRWVLKKIAEDDRQKTKGNTANEEAKIKALLLKS